VGAAMRRQCRRWGGVWQQPQQSFTACHPPHALPLPVALAAGSRALSEHWHMMMLHINVTSSLHLCFLGPGSLVGVASQWPLEPVLHDSDSRRGALCTVLSVSVREIASPGLRPHGRGLCRPGGAGGAGRERQHRPHRRRHLRTSGVLGCWMLPA